MTPTSDERREVAARLRENANKHGAVLDYLGGTQVASWWLLLHTIGCNSNEQEAAFRMLADLIDPCPSMADEQMGKLRRRSTALASMTRIASDMSGWAEELADSCERMSRTGLNPPDIAKSFRDMCGDGSMEWVYTPISARVLLDAADMLDENAKLRELVRDMWRFTGAACKKYPRLFDPPTQGQQTVQLNAIDAFEQRMRELGVDA